MGWIVQTTKGHSSHYERDDKGNSKWDQSRAEEEARRANNRAKNLEIKTRYEAVEVVE